MKPTEIIPDVGRPVAYYPSLAKVVGGVKAALLLCQIVYWSDKTKDEDGWIYKSVDAWEKETGLSYKEQRAARKKLLDIGVMQEWDDRAGKRLHFRFNRDALEDLWTHRQTAN